MRCVRTYECPILAGVEERRSSHRDPKLNHYCQHFSDHQGKSGKGFPHVVEPIGASSEGNPLRTYAEGKDFADHDPRNRSPGEAEADGVDPHKDDSSPPGISMIGPIVTEGASDACNNKMRSSHADAASDQNRFSPEVVDPQDGWDGGYEHDDAYNTCCKQRSRVAVQTKAVKDERGVVQNGVDLKQG